MQCLIDSNTLWTWLSTFSSHLISKKSNLKRSSYGIHFRILDLKWALFTKTYFVESSCDLSATLIWQLKHHTFHEQLICVSTGINIQNRNFCSPLFPEGCWSREESNIFPLQTAEWATDRQASDPFGRWVAWCCTVEPVLGLSTKFTKWKWRTKLVSVPLAVHRVLHVSKNPCSISTQVSVHWFGVLLHKTLLFPIFNLGKRKTAEE